MINPDRQQLFSALTLAITALFVASGYPPVARWRRQLRVAAIIGFLGVLALALVEIALWASGSGSE